MHCAMQEIVSEGLNRNYGWYPDCSTGNANGITGKGHRKSHGTGPCSNLHAHLSAALTSACISEYSTVSQPRNVCTLSRPLAWPPGQVRRVSQGAFTTSFGRIACL